MCSRTSQLLGLIALLFAMMGVSAGKSESVVYTRHWINKTRVHVIWVNLHDPTIMVTPVVANDTIGKRQSFISFLAQHQPLAQITGSYFALSSAHPIGDIVMGQRVVHRGPVGSALALRPDNSAAIINIPRGWLYSWPGYENVLQGGIRLVQNGKYAVYPRQQGFRDPGLFRPATRTAVGLDERNRLLLVAVNKPILLSDLAGIMKALKCRDAMTLDGGTSTGLAFGSDVILTPGRTLANVLMVVKRPVLIAPAAPPAPSAPPAPPAGTPAVTATTSAPAKSGKK